MDAFVTGNPLKTTNSRFGTHTGVFGIDTPPSLVTGRSISGGQIFTLVTGRKFQEICQICKGGTLCKMHFGIVTGPNSGDENFRIVTGSKLAAKRSLNGGYLTRIARYADGRGNW